MLSYAYLVLIGILYGVYRYCTRTFDYWKSRNVSGPKPIPMFGNIKEVALRRKHIGDVLKEIYDKFPNEKVVGIYRMTSPSLMVRDLDVAKDILVKNFDSFSDRGVKFREGVGLGLNLFHAQEEMWRVLRHKLTPMFSSGKIKGMFQFLDTHSDKLVNYIDSSKKIEHDAKLLLQKYTIGTISACAFGIDVDTNDAKQMEKLNQLDEIIFKNPLWFEVEQLFPGFFRKLGFSPFPKLLTDFFDNLVETVFTERGGVPSNRQDFMDMLLKLKLDKVQETKWSANRETITMEITDSMIAAQAFIFYAGGYETSSSTMSNMLYRLAKNPSVQDKLYVEIDEVMKRHGEKLTYDALSEMTYLGQVIDETLRMHPVSEALIRAAKVDYTFPGTNVLIKKGQVVFIPLVGIHYDEKYFPDPHIFDPERFAPENVKDRHPCAHMPFGTGQRNCIGSRFGKIQTSVCIVKLIYNFRVETSPSTPETIKVDPWRVVYSPKKGLYLNFIRRKKLN